VGVEPGRPVALVSAQRPAILRIAGVEMKHSDVVEFEFSVLPASASPVRVQTRIEELDGEGATARIWTSPWKTLPANCERAALSMRKPLEVERINLVCQFESDARDGAASVEWSLVAGIKLPEDSLAQLGLVAPDAFGAAPAPAAEPVGRTLRAPPLFSGIEIDHVLAIEDARYSHIDLKIFDLRSASDRAYDTRLKLVKRADDFHLEFRRRADWPSFFEHWPGTEADQHGPFFKLFAAADSLPAFRARASDNDWALMDSLLTALPRIVLAALNDPKAAQEDRASWQANMRQFIGILHESGPASQS